ncbi:hypothetical protein CATYP_10395 [Corynebacterium atypicum]|uniref:Uncharacterized protein n=1 Tax=Corynebacterium atypicum TaxID=191610 RepID=A0ABN4DEJ2_9CORY|nr:YqgE/AlgH family protein [Corynebacterium atypicum]AIG64884.1 hypothetical protein CATYP_10395 [Corynebacterium atypicum]
MPEEFFGDRLFTALERTDPAAGMLAVAAPGLPSVQFARSVVLIVQYNSYFTFGVDLTRRSDVAVANVLPEWADQVSSPPALYIGGPVEPQSVVGLGLTKNGVDIASRPRLTRLANRLVHLDLRGGPEEFIDDLDGARLFAGFAEWAPGQLEDEVDRGDWFITPALPSDVIAPGPADLWSDVMRRQSMPLPLFSTFPKDVVDN